MKIILVAFALSALFLGVMVSHSRTLDALSERTVKAQSFAAKKLARAPLAVEVYQPF